MSKSKADNKNAKTSCFLRHNDIKIPVDLVSDSGMSIISISYWGTHYFTLVNKACFGPCKSRLSKILVDYLNIKSHI